jgi:hypothetical protein
VDTKKERKYRIGLAVLVAIGLIYMAISIGVMQHLVQENNDFCQQRQVARTTIRTELMRRSDWTPEDQIILDHGLPEIVSC